MCDSFPLYRFARCLLDYVTGVFMDNRIQDTIADTVAEQRPILNESSSTYPEYLFLSGNIVRTMNST